MFSNIIKRLSGMQMIASGFFIIILIGTLLLLLPCANWRSWIYYDRNYCLYAAAPENRIKRTRFASGMF